MSRWVSMCTVWPPHSKLLSEYGEKSTLNFVLTLNITPQKLFRWCRRPQLWTTGDWQPHHNNAPPHASPSMQSFWQNIKSPSWLSPPPAQIWHPATSGFSKTRISFEREEFQTVEEIQENMTGQRMAIGTVWVSRCLLWRGLSHHCPMYNASCILYRLQQMYLFFILLGWIPSDIPYTHTYIYAHTYT